MAAAFGEERQQRNSWDGVWTLPGYPLDMLIYAVVLLGTWGFPGSSVGKESTCNAEDLGLIPELGRSLGETILAWRIS